MPKSHREEIDGNPFPGGWIHDSHSPCPAGWGKERHTPLQWGEPEAGIPELTLGVLRDIIINTARVLVVLWLCALPVVCLIGVLIEFLKRR